MSNVESKKIDATVKFKGVTAKKLAKAEEMRVFAKKILVLHITTSFGKRYTCRTVEELETFIDNYKKDKRLKRDEDVNIELGYGRITQAAYDSLLLSSTGPLSACKYFIKPA